MIELKVKKLDVNAQLPSYATDGSGCFDIRTTETKEIQNNCALIFETGLYFEIPEDYVMLVYSRSGHGFKNGVRLSNSVGIIDSDYRGHLMIKLHNDGSNNFHVNVGDRIAQAKLVYAPKCQFIEVDELSSTDRGVGGFGSTGSN
jgi:dUTP pyrophosphatase